ncbi:MAG: M28 family metallopeptidase [Lutibacter sp.]|uniref:M28 family metallopeptidase n=1 Tax=Lutibacter sp. TaxID=1925666 RepID=UPI00299DB77A|nr:M28 family metallopeptidase [Lutibacter sp.]MDX1827954.1 M28 family metallopeptidase [Lutibacter sp.]
MKNKSLLILTTLFVISLGFSQSKVDKILIQIATAPSAKNIKADITSLVNFGTRHTLSDTISNTRGIGAARRWVLKSFNTISDNCNNCLEVSYLGDLIKTDGRRITKDTRIVNVMAIQRGTTYPNHYVIMSGDIDSRVSDVNDYTSDAPGANDNATGLAGTLEAARVLSKYKFPVSIIYVGLSGEEQGLYGGTILAKYAKEHKWNIIGILNNDMIGNIAGIDGVIDNSTFRVFSEAISMKTTDRERKMMRYYGGEVDGPSRQLARYITKLATNYMTNLKPIMVYRLDRFGRGGHHKSFNDQGFTGVRIMETHENYNRQHQDVRTENGIHYGDVIEGVNFDYAAKLTAVNCLTLASLASAPMAPKNVMIAGAVKPSTRLKWETSDDKNIIGYKIYWRDTTSPQWQYSRFVGKVDDYKLKNIVIDNYLFGVASVGINGAESIVQFPNKLIPSGM